MGVGIWVGAWLCWTGLVATRVLLGGEWQVELGAAVAWGNAGGSDARRVVFRGRMGEIWTLGGGGIAMLASGAPGFVGSALL